MWNDVWDKTVTEAEFLSDMCEMHPEIRDDYIRFHVKDGENI